MTKLKSCLNRLIFLVLVLGTVSGAGILAWNVIWTKASMVPSTTEANSIQEPSTRVEPRDNLLIEYQQASSPAFNPDWLQVHFINVGQGDSIFIQTPEGTTALIDGGSGNGLALQYLQTQGVKQIDVMIASHPHADHIGGLVEVLQAMPVGVVWTSGATHSTSTFERFLDIIADTKTPYQEARPGDIISFGTLNFLVLSSNPNASNLNDSSLVVWLEYIAVSFLFTGDAETPTEEVMLQEVPDRLASTILKVGHHGSATSSSPAFLAAVAPRVAIYSAGVNNQYGHPHSTTLKDIDATQAQVYGTSVDGTITIQTDGTTYEVITAKGVSPTQPAVPPYPPSVSATPSLVESPELKYNSDEPDRDCNSFTSQAEAQAFFIVAGGPARDPHRLDGDDNGVACEHLR